MKLPLTDRRAMIKAFQGDDVWGWEAAAGAKASATVDAHLDTQAYESFGDGGHKITTTIRTLHVVEDDVAAAVGDLFTRNGETTWKAANIPPTDDGILKIELKKTT